MYTTKLIPIEKIWARYTSIMSQRFQVSSKCRTYGLSSPFLYFIQHIQVAIESIRSDMETIFHERPFLQLNLQRAISGERGFIKQSESKLQFSWRRLDTMLKAPTQVRSETQSQHLFVMSRPIHFRINNTTAIWTVKWNKLTFYSTGFEKPPPTIVHSAL